MTKFDMVPVIYAGDLPNDVEHELQVWDDEVALHYSTGVYSIWPDSREELPLFIAWMISIGAWSQADVDDEKKRLRFGLTGT